MDKMQQKPFSGKDATNNLSIIVTSLRGRRSIPHTCVLHLLCEFITLEQVAFLVKSVKLARSGQMSFPFKSLDHIPVH